MLPCGRYSDPQVPGGDIKYLAYEGILTYIRVSTFAFAPAEPAYIIRA